MPASEDNVYDTAAEAQANIDRNTTNNNISRMNIPSNYTSRITPERISSLKQGEIFVFGSNKRGMHGAGAARAAVDHFGAIWGQGDGLQGQSYAISTMESFAEMIDNVNRFIAFAKVHTEMTFLVTPIACGIAGYNPSQIAPLFKDAVELDNVWLPEKFWKELMK